MAARAEPLEEARGTVDDDAEAGTMAAAERVHAGYTLLVDDAAEAGAVVDDDAAAYSTAAASVTTHETLLCCDDACLRALCVSSPATLDRAIKYLVHVRVAQTERRGVGDRLGPRSLVRLDRAGDPAAFPYEFRCAPSLTVRALRARVGRLGLGGTGGTLIHLMERWNLRLVADGALPKLGDLDRPFGSYLAPAPLPGLREPATVLVTRRFAASFDYDSDETDVDAYAPGFYANRDSAFFTEPWPNH